MWAEFYRRERWFVSGVGVPLIHDCRLCAAVDLRPYFRVGFPLLRGLFGTDLVAFSAKTSNSSFGATEAAFYRNTTTGPGVIGTTATSSYASTLTSYGGVPTSIIPPATTVPAIFVLSFDSAVEHYTIFDPVPFAIFEEFTFSTLVALAGSSKRETREVVHTMFPPVPSARVGGEGVSHSYLSTGPWDAWTSSQVTSWVGGLRIFFP